MSQMNPACEKAIKWIEQHSVLLVFPQKNSPDPLSLWQLFHPRTPMRWEWDQDGDRRVSNLWSVMKTLSTSREVVYSKWYQNRATFFSRDLFTALLRLKREDSSLSATARQILETLDVDSPLSTKQLKRLTGLQGRFFEYQYQRALKELFISFQIVACGEVDDGAFPSLALGSTSLIFEDLSLRAQNLSLGKAQATLNQAFGPESKWLNFYRKNSF